MQYKKEDAKIIGLNLHGRDREYSPMRGAFITSAAECAENIMENHGKKCDTYKTAAAFLKEFKKREKFVNQPLKENEPDDDYLTEIEDKFLRDICAVYCKMLDQEYEHVQSDEYIDETIRANEYEFLESGKRA